MRVMGWVEWDEYMCVGCVELVRLLSGCCQVLRSIHRAGKVCTYLRYVSASLEVNRWMHVGRYIELG